MKNLRNKIKEKGEKFPKKHGEWFRVKTYNNNYLLLDTWNGKVYWHKDCESTGIDNMYSVVYKFTGYVGCVKENMANFWRAHIN